MLRTLGIHFFARILCNKTMVDKSVITSPTPAQHIFEVGLWQGTDWDSPRSMFLFGSNRHKCYSIMIIWCHVLFCFDSITHSEIESQLNTRTRRPLNWMRLPWTPNMDSEHGRAPKCSSFLEIQRVRPKTTCMSLVTRQFSSKIIPLIDCAIKAILTEKILMTYWSTSRNGFTYRAKLLLFSRKDIRFQSSGKLLRKVSESVFSGAELGGFKPRQIGNYGFGNTTAHEKM